MYGSSRSGFAHVNAMGLHYREWGEHGSPDLLLVHGWSTSSVVWIDVAEALKDSYHIIAPDNRGTGESERPASGYLLRDYALDVHHLIEELRLEEPSYVGHSWGANIGAYMAAEFPGDIARAVLEDPVYWRMVDAFATLIPGLVARSKRTEDEVRAEAEQRGLAGQQVDRELYLHKKFPASALTQVAYENRGWALECEGFLRRIAVPTLMLIADSEAGGYILPEELGHYRDIASAEVEFRLWEGVGHMMHGTEPERFVQEVREYLAY